MFGLGKKFVLVVVCVLVVSSLLLVTPCMAPVTMPANPSVAPEIVSVKINSEHYWWPPSYTTNPYTGELLKLFQENTYQEAL
jgi:hypothetical protein